MDEEEKKMTLALLEATYKGCTPNVINLFYGLKSNKSTESVVFFIRTVADKFNHLREGTQDDWVFTVNYPMEFHGKTLTKSKVNRIIEFLEYDNLITVITNTKNGFEAKINVLNVFGKYLRDKKLNENFYNLKLRMDENELYQLEKTMEIAYRNGYEEGFRHGNNCPETKKKVFKWSVSLDNVYGAPGTHLENEIIPWCDIESTLFLNEFVNKTDV